MADALTGPQPFIDLTVTGARNIRATGITKIHAIRINGTTGAGSGNIVLRRTTAGSGPVVFRLNAGATTNFDGTANFDNNGLTADGLFMDDQGTAWTAGAHMIIYTAEPA